MHRQGCHGILKDAIMICGIPDLESEWAEGGASYVRQDYTITAGEPTHVSTRDIAGREIRFIRILVPEEEFSIKRSSKYGLWEEGCVEQTGIPPDGHGRDEVLPPYYHTDERMIEAALIWLGIRLSALIIAIVHPHIESGCIHVHRSFA